MEQTRTREFIEAPVFKDELSSIVSTPLSTENIDTYADAALTQLIGLVGKTVTEYRARPTIIFLTEREQEEAAFGYFGLENIEAILDHIAEKSDELHNLDVFISGIEQQDRLFLPPDDADLTDSPEAADAARETKIVSRLKTLLFIATNLYDVDLSKQSDISVTKGTNDPSMMRTESYYSVLLPKLERQILINDEVGNATYIFNTAVLSELPESDTLLDHTKSQLNRILEGVPSAGQRLVYNENYVANLIAALDDPATRVDLDRVHAADRPEAPTFLLPDKAPEGWLTMTALQRKLGVSLSPMKNILEDYADEIGQISAFRSKGRRGVVPYYSEQQQEVFERVLQQKELLNGPAPEGYKNQKSLAAEWGINPHQIANAALELNDELGNVVIYQLQTKGAPRPFFSPQQIKKIYDYLDEQGVFTRLPDGYKFMRNFADELGLSHETVQKAMAAIDELGEIEIYRSRVRQAVSLSPEQQTKVYEHLAKLGFFTQAPKGYIPQSEFTKILGFDHRRLKQILASPNLDIGPIRQFKYGEQLLKCYSPEQQAAIIAFTNEHRLGVYHMPAGYKSIRAIAKELSMSYAAIAKAVSAVEDKLGDVHIYTSGFNNVKGFSPEQQVVIKDMLYETTGFGKEHLPDDYIAFQKFARLVHISDATLWKISSEIADFGEIEVFANGVNNKMRGISPRQQDLVRKYLGRS